MPPPLHLKRPAMMIFVDPMCSWCYGFAPQLEQLIDRYARQIAMRPILGGLRAGEQMPMDDRSRIEIRTHWNHVAQSTRQPFDYGFFERERFVYDTAPACQGVAAVRRLEDLTRPTLSPDGEIIKSSRKPFEYLLALHTAFYANGKDITKEEGLADVAVSCGLDRQEFLNSYHHPETLKKTQFDFLMTRQSQIKGFPTLILGTYEDGFQILAQGYAKFDDLAPKIEQYLRTQLPGKLN